MAFSARASDAPLAQINVTPLVDVLLVLLVIMMITAPMVTHKVALDLPQYNIVDQRTPAEPVRITLDANGGLRWNDIPVDMATLEAQMVLAARSPNVPHLQLDIADGVAYQRMAEVIAAAKRHGLVNIDFSGEP